MDEENFEAEVTELRDRATEMYHKSAGSAERNYHLGKEVAYNIILDMLREDESLKYERDL